MTSHKILYDLSRPQWWVGLGAGLGVGQIHPNCVTRKIYKIKQKFYDLYVSDRTNSYEFIFIWINNEDYEITGIQQVLKISYLGLQQLIDSHYRLVGSAHSARPTSAGCSNCNTE